MHITVLLIDYKDKITVQCKLNIIDPPCHIYRLIKIPVGNIAEKAVCSMCIFDNMALYF